MIIPCLFSVILIGIVSSYPWGNEYANVHPRVMMMSGFYGRQLSRRSNEYIPQGSISAFVNRDAIATNSYAGDPINIPKEQLPLDESKGAETEIESTDGQEFPVHEILDETPEPKPTILTDPHQVANEEAYVPINDGVEKTTKASKKASRKKVQKPIAPEEDEEEDEEPNKRRYVPSNNVYFPITISGSGGARSRNRNGAGAGDQEDDFFVPGSATAIANSYSTGRGGIATSHATSFGDPYLASMLYRSGFFNNNKAKKGQIDA